MFDQVEKEKRETASWVCQFTSSEDVRYTKAVISAIEAGFP
jgi:hypothetical protein